MNDTYEDQHQSAGDPTDRSRHDDHDIAARLRQPLAGQSEDGLPLGAVFDILRNERRQQVLGYVAVTDDDVVRTGELAEHVAAIENDVAVDALSSQQRKRVYVALYQCHLPKMADAGVLEFDKDRGVVRRGPNADQITPYLDVQTEEDAAAPPVRRSVAVFATTCLLAYLLAASLAERGAVLGGAAILAGLAVGAVIEYRDRDRDD